MGVVPPFAGVAVNVTVSPAQIELSEAVIERVGVTFAVTIIVVVSVSVPSAFVACKVIV